MISIESNVFSKEEVAKIQKTLGIRLNEPIDVRDTDKGLKELHQSGNFQTLRVETENTPAGVRVFILGTKMRYIRNVKYTGIDSEVVDAAKKGQELQEGAVADLGKLSGLRERMKQEYESRGYYFAEIQIATSDVPGTKEVDVEIEGKLGQPTRISKVQMSGISSEEFKELRDILPLKRGGIFTKENVDKSSLVMNEFFRTNRYPTARIEETAFNFSEDKLSVEIQYTLKLGERFQFEFHGNKVLGELELRETLTPEVLSQSDSSLRIKEAVENKYRSLGFHFVKVDVKSAVSPREKINVVRFEVDEGSRVIIDKITFNGGDEFGASKLERLFFDNSPGVVNRHLYWEAGVNQAMERMMRKLELEGYLKAQVLGPRVAFNEDKKGVELFFDVELGNRTYISEIKIVGNRYASETKIREQLSFKLNDPVNTEKLDQGKRSLLAYYQNEGFTDVKIEEADLSKMLTVSGDQRQAAIHLTITEGTQFFVGEISIDGNRRTQDKVILREMLLKTGDKYSPELLRNSEENIALLGLFSRVEIISSPNTQHKDVKDLKIVVVEIKPGFGEVGLGASYENPRFRPRTFLGLAYRNLLGLNQTASLRSELAIPIAHGQTGTGKLIEFVEYAAVLGYRVPYPFDIPFTFSTQVGLDSYEVATFSSRPVVQTRARIEERVEKRLSSRVTGIYRLHRYERTTTELPGPVHPDYPKKTDTIGSTGPGLIIDLRNDPFNPVTGSYHTVDLEFAHPALLANENTAFLMAINRNSFYFPLFEPFSFIFYVGGGYAHSLFNSPLPTARLTSDLSLGGQSSLRGYSPKEYQLKGDPHDTAYWNTRGELVISLFENVSSAVFMDSGQLFAQWRPDERKDGIGIGLRYRTPVGPIVIDMAYGFQSQAKNVKFSFTIGSI